MTEKKIAIHTLAISSLLFFVYVLIYVPMKKPMRLKNGAHACSGRKFCATARATGDVAQLTFIIGRNPAFIIARICVQVRAPAITDIEAR
jgi:hypothetical protein